MKIKLYTYHIILDLFQFYLLYLYFFYIYKYRFIKKLNSLISIIWRNTSLDPGRSHRLSPPPPPMNLP